MTGDSPLAARAEPRAVIAALGDIHSGDNPPGVSVVLRDLLAGADAVIVNLESPLADRGEPRAGKSAHLRSAPSAVSLLKRLNASVACLANNHICDWGPQALSQTLEILRHEGIAPVGAGLSIEEAARPVVMEVGGVSLAVLAFAEPRIQAPPAGEGRCGVVPLEQERVMDTVRAMRKQVDCVIVNAHWGYTNYHYPAPEHLALGRALVDAGATLVLGHHPHVVQGIERMGERAVAYSLGNHVFAAYKRRGKTIRLSRENYTGLVLLVRLDRQGIVSLECRHSWQHAEANVLRLLDGHSARRRDRQLARWSGALARRNYGAFFRRYVLLRMFSRALRWLNPRQWSSLNRDFMEGVASAMRLVTGKSDAKGGPGGG